MKHGFTNKSKNTFRSWNKQTDLTFALLETWTGMNNLLFNYLGYGYAISLVWNKNASILSTDIIEQNSDDDQKHSNIFYLYFYIYVKKAKFNKP